MGVSPGLASAFAQAALYIMSFEDTMVTGIVSPEYRCPHPRSLCRRQGSMLNEHALKVAIIRKRRRATDPGIGLQFFRCGGHRRRHKKD